MPFSQIHSHMYHSQCSTQTSLQTQLVYLVESHVVDSLAVDVDGQLVVSPPHLAHQSITCGDSHGYKIPRPQATRLEKSVQVTLMGYGTGLVPRPPCPAFVACSTKSGAWRPGNEANIGHNYMCMTTPQWNKRCFHSTHL